MGGCLLGTVVVTGMSPHSAEMVPFPSPIAYSRLTATRSGSHSSLRLHASIFGLESPQPT